MKERLSHIIILVNVFFNLYANAQNKTIDSLQLVLKNQKSERSKSDILNLLSEKFDQQNEYENAIQYADSALIISQKNNDVKNKIRALNNLGNAYIDSGNSDGALSYYYRALNLNISSKNKKEIANSYNLIGIIHFNRGNYATALKNYAAALRINNEINNKKALVKNYLNIGNVYNYTGNYPQALKNLQSGLKLAESLFDIAKIYNNIALSHFRQGNYNDALTYYFKALKINEEVGNKEEVASNYNNIALIYTAQNNYPDALKNQLSSLKLNSEIGDKEGLANNYINIGIIYEEQGKYAEALENQEASLKINEEIGDKKGISNNYDNLGAIYFKLGNYQEALRNYLLSLDIIKGLEDKEGMANSYINVGGVYTKQKKFDKAHEYLSNGLTLSRQIGNKIRMKESYIALAMLDSARGNWKGAYENNKMYLVYRDSLINEVNTKKLVQSQMNYEFEKIQASEKLIQESKDKLARKEKQRQQVITNAITIGLILVVIFLILLFNRFRITLQQKRVIELQKGKAEQQRKLIEEKNKQVIDSINYAKRIQKAILPPVKTIDEFLPDSFILYIPKDIVAGDFYWMERSGDVLLVAACDCTGHGVPGALVSVICNNALNRAVREFHLVQPAVILDKVTEIVIENFDKSEDLIRDGMDISLCAYHAKTGILQYAGANNPLWILRNNEILETKANKQHIGIYENRRPFTNHEFLLEPNDTCYIFSDGFADQFGGETGNKKLTRKRFKELILSLQHLDMKTQGLEFDIFFYQYKKEIDQTDDILVMGIRF